MKFEALVIRIATMLSQCSGGLGSACPCDVCHDAYLSASGEQRFASHMHTSSHWEKRISLLSHRDAALTCYTGR